MTREEKIICKQFLNDADTTHSCNEYKLLMALLDQEPTTKNDAPDINVGKIGSTTKDYLGVDYLGIDCVSRSDVLKLMQDNWHTHNGDWAMQESMDDIRALPPATPQDPILDKIREQIKSHLRGVEITLEVLVENDPLRPKMEGAKDTLEECLEIIDKAESEDK